MNHRLIQAERMTQEGFLRPLEHPRHLGLVLHTWKHDREVVRIYPRQQGGISKPVRQPIRDLLQERIADRSPETLVDILESLQVHKPQGKSAAAAASNAKVL